MRLNYKSRGGLICHIQCLDVANDGGIVHPLDNKTHKTWKILGECGCYMALGRTQPQKLAAEVRCLMLIFCILLLYLGDVVLSSDSGICNPSSSSYGIIYSLFFADRSNAGVRVFRRRFLGCNAAFTFKTCCQIGISCTWTGIYSNHL